MIIYFKHKFKSDFESSTKEENDEYVFSSKFQNRILHMENIKKTYGNSASLAVLHFFMALYLPARRVETISLKENNLLSQTDNKAKVVSFK